MTRPRWTMNALRMLAVCTAALAASCSDSHPQNQVGGETHFLKACIDGLCGDGLECVCGICTIECDGRSECAQFGEDATCVALDRASVICEGEPAAERVCDVRCDESSECSDLGGDRQCVEERCRPTEIATQIAAAADAGVDAGHDAALECTDETCGKITDPLVLFVVDTSGSMERKTQCTCTSASCKECLPQCAGSGSDKNRWTQVLEALTGTFEGYACEAIDRAAWADEPDSTYDVPFHKPLGTQRDDGVLRTFIDRVRFGLATFDAVGSYEADEQRSIEEFSIERSSGVEGMWSYPPSDDWTETGTGAAAYQVYRYPGCPHPYVMNTGIRSRDAGSGALFVDMGDTSRAAAINGLQESLLATRPYGGTPIAAALDDVRALFEHDPWMAPERAMPDHPRHVVLITDGRPNDDYRNVHCDCNEPEADKNCAQYLSPTESATDMRCPYPTAARAARTLLADGVVDGVHVVGFDIDHDVVASDIVREIARQAGGKALFANTAEQLGGVLTRVMQSILSEPQVQPMLGDACTTGEYVYADGARWLERCASCECVGGLIECTGSDDCQLCERDWDCNEGEYCEAHGYCTTAASVTCDKPTNFDAFCGVNGVTYDDPCTARTAIRHGGACDETSCMWLTAVIAHGAPAPSSGPCEACTCLEGVIECDWICGEPCTSTQSCRANEVCVLPLDQCVASEEETGHCERVPVHCSGMIDDDRQWCGCDGNFYSRCELLRSRQNEASTQECSVETN